MSLGKMMQGGDLTTKAREETPSKLRMSRLRLSLLTLEDVPSPKARELESHPSAGAALACPPCCGGDMVLSVATPREIGGDSDTDDTMSMTRSEESLAVKGQGQSSPCEDLADDDFGWFDMEEDVPVADPKTRSYSSVQAVQARFLVDSHTARSARGSARAAALGTSYPLMRSNAQLLISTKCFNGKTFAWALGGVRLVQARGGGQHAEFQVIACMGNPEDVRSIWLRYSAFQRLSEFTQGRGFEKSEGVWSHVKKTQRIFRCLEKSYLQCKSHLLERYLRQVLFDSCRPDIILAFVDGSLTTKW